MTGVAGPAVWEGYPVLICRGEEMINCNTLAGECETHNSGATWRVDFRDNVVRYLTVNHEEQIVSRRHAEYGGGGPDLNAIFLSSGRVATFDPPAANREVEMSTLERTTATTVSVINFTCAPPTGG